MPAIAAKNLEEARREGKRKYGEDILIKSGRRMRGKSSEGNWYRFEWSKKGAKKWDPAKKLRELEKKMSEGY